MCKIGRKDREGPQAASAGTGWSGRAAGDYQGERASRFIEFFTVSICKRGLRTQ
jgi:hypothetical protein